MTDIKDDTAMEGVLGEDVTGMVIYLVKEGDEIDVRGIGQIKSNPDKDDLSAMVFMDAVMFYARHLHDYPEVLQASSKALQAKVDADQQMFGDEAISGEPPEVTAAMGTASKKLH